MKPDKKYKLLTFYKFVDIDDPHAEVAEMKEFTSGIGMKGRIFIGEEGINATCTGNLGQVKALRLYLDTKSIFQDIPDIDSKVNDVDGHKFPKMIVRYRNEIVALGVRYNADAIAKHRLKISPDKFKHLLDESPQDLAILDLRNNYEYQLGHFKGAIPAGTLSFRETANFLKKYKDEFKNKQVVMYCTGGIRCEKAAVMLAEAGLDNVMQLDGGVVKYVNSYRDGNWLGNLYTFDDRVSARVNDDDKHVVISKCHYTGQLAEEFHNCRYGPCNRQFIALNKEYKKHLGFCCFECAQKASEDFLIRNVPWDLIDYKAIRLKIKQNPELSDELIKQMTEHLANGLRGVIFNHSVPIDEFDSIDL